jgi:ATP phosphoribosyltransferase regulatory subunit
MLSADTLLDLYGEDIRARAYTTDDPDRGEMMLRPDFTVPVVEMHAEHGSEPARYTYLGEVFRKQPVGSGRPVGIPATGFRAFRPGRPGEGRCGGLRAVFRSAAGLGLRAVTGDMGILLAAIESLSTTEPRKAALRRHVWRPRRFRALLDRYTGRVPPSPDRAAAGSRGRPNGLDAVIDAPGGNRPAHARRYRRPDRDAARRCADAPHRRAEADVLGAILSLKADLPDACERLRDMTVDMPGLTPESRRPASPPGSTRCATPGSTPRPCRSRRASGAPRWNTTTVSSSASSRPRGPTCRRWPPAGAMTR